MQSVTTLSVEGARDASGEGRAFVEFVTSRQAYFEQELIPLRLRFGFERAFLAADLVQPFRQHLDVPAQVQAPWLREAPGAIALAEDETVEIRAAKRSSFALDESVVQAVQLEDRIVDGRTFAAFEIERTYIANRSGELVIPGPVLRFAYATIFREDVFNGRVATDRIDAFVRGKGLDLRIQPLPEAGRPPGFTGAVGHFSLAAEAEPRDLVVGESLELALIIEGRGNLEFFAAPRLDGLTGFRVQGTVDRKSRRRRTVNYDLAPRSEGVREIAPIAFAFFDTEPPVGYRTLETRAIPLTVRARPVNAAPGAADGGDDTTSASGSRSESARGSPTRLLLGALVVLVCGGALGLRVWRIARARRLHERDPARIRVRRAAAAFHASVAAPDARIAEAFAEFLSTCLGCSTAAVIAPDLAARLAAGGVPIEQARRAALLLESLVAARFGGVAPADGLDSARGLVDELERSFASRRTQP